MLNEYQSTIRQIIEDNPALAESLRELTIYKNDLLRKAKSASGSTEQQNKETTLKILHEATTLEKALNKILNNKYEITID